MEMIAPIGGRPSAYNTGVAAEYFVLSQLYRMGFEAYITFGNRKSIDIRIISSTGAAATIDVKAVKGFSSVIINNVVPIQNHFIVAVIYNDQLANLQTYPETFIIPSQEIESVESRWGTQRRLLKRNLGLFKDAWELLNVV